MSVDHSDDMHASGPEWAALRAHAATAAARSDARLTAQIEDFFIADADRLDDRTRAAAAATLRGAVLGIAHDLAACVADRSLGDSVDPGAVPGAPDQVAAAVLHRLLAAGLLRDRALLEELFARVRHDMLSDALLANRAPGAEPGLLPAWIAGSDDRLSRAALAYRQAEGRRRAGACADLPPAQRERLIWSVAAALRAQWRADAARQVTIDRAVAAAAQRAMSADEDQDRLETAADRLAAALDDSGIDPAGLLVGALEEGHLALAIALLSRPLAFESADVRALLLDPADDRLWLALRAIDLDRAVIARIGFLLGDADPRRNLDSFAERLAAIAAIPADTARDGLAMLALPRPFRAALRALDRAVMQ